MKKTEKNEIAKVCEYCEYSEKTADFEETEEMLCRKHGVVPAGHTCRKFKYDLLKREPREKPVLADFSFVSLDEE